ncbi:hypothetical protein QJ48_17400 [Paenibacillus sp. A3]|nr:hypothetical protein QJ48_17400 [Paenibacillus sp. A3]
MVVIGNPIATFFIPSLRLQLRGREILLMHTVVITNVSNKEQMITIIKLGNGHLLRRHLHPMDLTGQTEKQKKQQIY